VEVGHCRFSIEVGSNIDSSQPSSALSGRILTVFLEKWLAVRDRQTVDYLAGATRVIAVVNTTGTPSHRRRLLHDVAFWYGLGEAIEHGVLKSVSGNIKAYERGADGAALVAHVIEDFCSDYDQIRLPDGARGKLALDFPQTKDLRALRPPIWFPATRTVTPTSRPSGCRWLARRMSSPTERPHRGT
jgi:hypothetical protein